jgi:hypothetical protein
MAVQIVMDPTGDTRHEFTTGDATAVAKRRAPVQAINRGRLYGSGTHRRGSLEAHSRF